jgi:hypothetical protein
MRARPRANMTRSEAFMAAKLAIGIRIRVLQFKS